MQQVFVFGSNLAGIHGAGAALWARQFCGAELGVGEGITGSSYAIPTKDNRIRTLPLEKIREHVDVFLRFASDNPSMTFKVTRIGCGLAGYSDGQMAPLFTGAPQNCLFPEEWLPYLPDATTWGRSPSP